MTHTTPQHTIACVPLPEDECICPDLVPGCRRPNPVLSAVSDTPIADAAEAAGHNVITMDDIRVDPATAGLFKDFGVLPTQVTYPAGLEGTGVLTIPDPETNLVSIHNTDGELTAAYTMGGNLIGGSLHRELLHLTAHKSHNRAVSAQRDTAIENANFWRRLAIIASGACVVGSGINIGNALGWW
jgi:hypothetical protein